MADLIKIRPYRSRDKAAVLQILLRNIPEFFAESEWTDLEDYLDNKIEKYFVAEVDNEIIGGSGLNFGDDPAIARLSWDLVLPQFQGTGVGSRLLLYRIEYLKSLCRIKTVTVRTSQLAYVFYEKHGFKLTKTILNYWAPGFDLYQMEKNIAID